MGQQHRSDRLCSEWDPGTGSYNGVDWQAFVAGDVTSGLFEADQFTGLGQAVVVSRFPAQMSNAAVTAG